MAGPANPSEALDAIVDRLAQLYPPGHSKKAMAENGNGAGQYQAIRVEVDAVKGQLHDFKDDINSRFSSLSDDIKSISRTLSEFIQTVGSRGGESFYKVAGIAAGAITIGLTIVAGFGSLAKVNLDTNIAFTNDKIATTNASIDKLASIVFRLSETTIPRAELDYRINANRDALSRKADKDVLDEIVKRHDDIIYNVRADVERLKNDIVSRRENESHWNDYQNRINLLSNRVTDLQKESAGEGLAAQIKGVKDELSALQQKFITIPK